MGNQNSQVTLGSASTYAVLSYDSISNTGPSVLGGDIGTMGQNYHGITGFPPGYYSGTENYSPSTEINDANSAYSAILSKSYTSLTGDLGGMILGPGVYTYSSSAELTGILTLSGTNSSTDAWYFQIHSTLTTASAASVVLRNGAQGCNVYWQVGSSATLGTGTAFVGNILAAISITATTGASVMGGLFALGGSVTLDTNIVQVQVCKAIPSSTSVKILPTSSSSKPPTTSSSSLASSHSTASSSHPPAIMSTSSKHPTTSSTSLASSFSTTISSNSLVHSTTSSPISHLTTSSWSSSKVPSTTSYSSKLPTISSSSSKSPRSSSSSSKSAVKSTSSSKALTNTSASLKPTSALTSSSKSLTISVSSTSIKSTLPSSTSSPVSSKTTVSSLTPSSSHQSSTSISPSTSANTPNGCTRSYTVASGDYCYAIYTKFGITEAQFYAYNPSLDSNCDLSIGQVLCVFQCTKFYTVESGDYCYQISTKFGITETQLQAYNPSLDANCDLLIGQVLCVSGAQATRSTFTMSKSSLASTAMSTSSSRLPTTSSSFKVLGSLSASKSPTTSTNPLRSTTPTTLCTRFYTVVSGDYCYGISAEFDITKNQLVSYNPSLDTNCDLEIGQVLCVSEASPNFLVSGGPKEHNTASPSFFLNGTFASATASHSTFSNVQVESGEGNTHLTTSIAPKKALSFSSTSSLSTIAISPAPTVVTSPFISSISDSPSIIGQASPAPTISPMSIQPVGISTIYSTTVYKIISCAPTIMDCPARIGSLTTQIVQFYPPLTFEAALSSGCTSFPGSQTMMEGEGSTTAPLSGVTTSEGGAAKSVSANWTATGVVASNSAMNSYGWISGGRLVGIAALLGILMLWW